MMYRFSFLFSLVLLFSCNSNTIYKEPKNLIPKDTMVLLLTDMYTAISANNVKNKYGNKTKNYMSIVHEKYKIDSIRFNESNSFYTSKIEPYNAILEQVKQKIEVQRDSFNKELNIKDSIKKAKRELNKNKTRRRDSIRKLNRLIVKDSITKWSKSYFLKLDEYFLETPLIISDTETNE